MVWLQCIVHLQCCHTDWTVMCVQVCIAIHTHKLMHCPPGLVPSEASGGGDFGPKYQAHVGELQRQLDEARAALAEKDAHLASLAEERQALSDELNVLKGMGGMGAGAAAGAAAAELAGERSRGGRRLRPLQCMQIARRRCA